MKSAYRTREALSVSSEETEAEGPRLAFLLGLSLLPATQCGWSFCLPRFSVFWSWEIGKSSPSPCLAVRSQKTPRRQSQGDHLKFETSQTQFQITAKDAWAASFPLLSLVS